MTSDITGDYDEEIWLSFCFVQNFESKEGDIVLDLCGAFVPLPQ